MKKSETKEMLKQIIKEIRKLKKMQKSMCKTNTPEDRLIFWSTYLKTYDQCRKLKEKYPFLPKLPKCLLTPKEEQNVKQVILMSN